MIEKNKMVLHFSKMYHELNDLTCRQKIAKLLQLLPISSLEHTKHNLIEETFTVKYKKRRVSMVAPGHGFPTLPYI